MTSINDVTRYEVEDEVAVISVDNPPVNALGHAARSGIGVALDRAFADPAAAAVVLRCDGRTFFAGADITEFGKPMASPVLRELAVQIEGGGKPVIAAIHGMALGGGLETALACHWRIAEKSARMGLPEVKLGLLAGAGGTQRLPRLVGAAKALDMVVGGDPIGASEALEAGLIDVIAASDLRGEAIAFAKRVAEMDEPLRRVRDMAPPLAEGQLFAHFRNDNAERLHGFDAPEASIRCIEAAVSMEFDDGMVFERRLFDGLMPGSQCAAQRYAFFAERDAAKIPGLAKVTGIAALATVSLLGSLSELPDFAARLTAAGITVNDDAVRRDGAHLALARDVEGPARAGLGGSLIASMARDASSVHVSIGPSLSAPALLEILRQEMTTDEALTVLLTLAKRLNLTPVVTLAGEAPIGHRMLKSLETSVTACIANGVPLGDLVATAAAFGLVLGGPTSGSVVEFPDMLIGRLIAPLINEGAKILSEGSAARASDIDIVCVKLGMWKVYRGGPMFHADQIGLDTIIETLSALAAEGQSGCRPAPLLEQLRQAQMPLHQVTGATDA